MLSSWLGSLLLVLSVSARSAGGDPPAIGDDLQRAAFLGVRVAAIADEERHKLKLEGDAGIVVEEVFAESTAKEAGIQVRDVLLSLNGKPLRASGDLVSRIAAMKGGDAVEFAIRRGAESMTKKTLLKPRPRETSREYAIEYTAVMSRAGKLRAIVTRPHGGGRKPALFLIQGVGLASIDNPIGPLAPYKAIVEHFTKRGFVTLRVDKPGAGDSQGGPARDVDFDTELDGYREGLAFLKTRADVDPENVFILGHSMGGVMAPLIAKDEHVRGIVVYGTIARTWPEYMLENSRRQMELAEREPAMIDDRLKQLSALLTYLYLEKTPPAKIAREHPELRSLLAESITEDKYFVDRSVTFFSQLTDKNLGSAWSGFEGDVLALWGAADFVSAEDDHALIARIVNGRRPGNATFQVIDETDHGFASAESKVDAYERMRANKPGEFNRKVVDVVFDWVEKVSAKRST